MIDAVVSVHTDPLTCGTAKFNQELARRLGVPCVALKGAAYFAHPLYSLKAPELADESLAPMAPFSLFLHEWDWRWQDLAPRATTVWCGNQAIAREATPFCRSEPRVAFCPSAMVGDPTRGQINVLTFGMAHKFQRQHFDKLKALLDDAPHSYTVSLSTAIHEGKPWDVSFRENVDLMQGIFGTHLRHLGFLGDDALAAELQRATAAALFFDPAVRANNTSAWTVLEAECPLITTLDDDSPVGLIHAQTCFDVTRLDHWPTTLGNVGAGGVQVPAAWWNWDLLMKVMAPVCVPS